LTTSKYGAKRLTARPRDNERPDHDLRVSARGFLHAGSDVHGIAVDIQAGELHSLGAAATRLLEVVERDLGEHPLAERVDDIERNVWQAFIERVRSLAGES